MKKILYLILTILITSNTFAAKNEIRTANGYGEYNFKNFTISGDFSYNSDYIICENCLMETVPSLCGNSSFLNKKNIRQIKSDVILLPRNNISVTSYVDGRVEYFFSKPDAMIEGICWIYFQNNFELRGLDMDGDIVIYSGTSNPTFLKATDINGSYVKNKLNQSVNKKETADNSTSKNSDTTKSNDNSSSSQPFIEMCKNSKLSDLDKDVAMLCLEKMDN